jgi:hypothetical protein
MNRCDDCLLRIDFYLDDELYNDDLEIFGCGAKLPSVG